MSTRLQRWRVPLGFAAAVALIALARPYRLSLWIGLPIGCCGLWLRAAAAGHIRKNDVLAETGPYRYTRNPLYLGSALIGAGLVVAAGSWWLALLAGALLVGVYLPVIRAEEAHLSQRFGTAFAAYAARVPRLWPRWPQGDAVAGSGGGFSWALYRRHREYQALLGFVGLGAVLIFKACLPPGWPVW